MIVWWIVGGLLAGLFLFRLLRGHSNDPVSVELFSQELMRSDHQSSFPEIYKDKTAAIAFAHLAGWLIKKNSRDPKNRILFALEYFKAKFDEAFHLEDELFRSLEYSIHIRSVASGVNRKMRLAAERKQLIDFMIDLAFVDGDINQREYVALVRFGQLIGVQLSYLDKVVSARRAKFNYGQNATIDLLSNNPFKRRKALESLGLKESASVSEVKKAYRKLVKTHHPDKFMNDSDDNRAKAAELFREIREAYEFLIS